MKDDQNPTMLTLSILDIKEPAVVEGKMKITEHWCLAHYLIDGHHKAYAAFLEKKPLAMISFLAIDQGASTESDVDKRIPNMENL